MWHYPETWTPWRQSWLTIPVSWQERTILTKTKSAICWRDVETGSGENHSKKPLGLTTDLDRTVTEDRDTLGINSICLEGKTDASKLAGSIVIFKQMEITHRSLKFT